MAGGGKKRSNNQHRGGIETKRDDSLSFNLALK